MPARVIPSKTPLLYDWEYRRRRDDVRFYRTLADERGGPILDLGCGTGRLMVPLLRAGHVVVGVDRAPAMLARAAARRRAGWRRASGVARCCCAAICARSPSRRRFQFAVAAFHSIQHLATDRELGALLRRRRARAAARRLVRVRHVRAQRAVPRPRERAGRSTQGAPLGADALQAPRDRASAPNTPRAIGSPGAC